NLTWGEFALFHTTVKVNYIFELSSFWGSLQSLYRSSQISDGNLVSVGISSINGSNCGLILKSKLNGQIEWIHRYDYNERTDFFIDFAETQDKGFIITGAASYGGQSTGQDTWLLKLDNNGCLEPGCLEVGIEEAEQDMGITLYPNPTQDRLFIKTEQSQKRPLKFSLYNMQGKLIIQEQLVAEYESFDLSNLVSGVYLVNIVDGSGARVTKKIIKQ
ncbi:MAG: T9SS type A sorting domain-containing protein, partial [Flavobacteriales bacterium]